MNYIEYIADINAPLSNSFKIDYDTSKVTKIEVEKQDTSLILRFHFEDTNIKEEEVYESTHQLAIDITNLISYKFNLGSKSLHRSVFCRNGKRTLYGWGDITGFATMQMIGDNTLQIKEGVMDEALLKELRSNPYHSMFREIMLVNHTLSKYLLLYSLIYLICGDNQKKVEAFVKDNEQNVEIMGRKRSNGETEYTTVYTTLRNRIGHMSTDEGISSLTEDMTRTMNGLIRLARIAIEQTHSS
jgi:hypothetical protein